MDIHTAAKYMKLGYRVNRTGWTAVVYAYNFHGTIWVAPGNFILSFGMNDLLADDWEVITDGIVQDFPITYQD
jgi:hypothetical protein